MKRFILSAAAILLAVIMAVCAGACAPSYEDSPYISVSDVYGTWSRETDGGREQYIFREDMSYVKTSTGEGGGITVRGSYKVYENKIDLISDTTGKASTHYVAFEDGKMKWGSGSFTLEFTKEK